MIHCSKSILMVETSKFKSLEHLFGCSSLLFLLEDCFIINCLHYQLEEVLDLLLSEFLSQFQIWVILCYLDIFGLKE